MKAMLGVILFLAAFCAGLSAQQAPTQPSPQAETQFQVGGVLVDAVTGQPISQARVAIAPLSQRDAYTTLTTGEDGQFLFGSLKAGNYTLEAQRRGYLTRSYAQHEQFSSYIAVGPGLGSSNLIFRLPPECAISGRISDEAGEPIREAEVLLYKSGNMQGEQATRPISRKVSDFEGLYHFTHLQPGNYFIVVIAKVWYAQRPARSREVKRDPGGGMTSIEMGLESNTYAEEDGRSPLDVAYPITFYPGVTEASGAAPIVVKSGERFVADVTLQPAPALHFRVPKDEGSGDTKPMVGRASYYQLQTSLFGTPVVFPFASQDSWFGEIMINGIPPGQYQIESLENSGSLRKSVELNALANGEISLGAETPSIPVTATVQFDPGTPTVIQGRLGLSNVNTREASGAPVTSAGEIDFKNPIGPGTYQVSLNSNAGVFIKSLTATGARVNGRMLQVKGSGPVHLAVVLAHGEAEIQGVALRDGKPFTGAMIVLVPENPAHNHALFRRDQSNTDGSFMLAAVVPGKYTLLALEHGWELEWMNPSALKPYLSGGETLQVQENGKYELKPRVQ